MKSDQSRRARSLAIVMLSLATGVLGMVFGPNVDNAFGSVSSSLGGDSAASDTSASLKHGDDRPMDLSTFTLIMPPATMQDMVSRADAVLIGTISDITYEQKEGPYSRYEPKEANQQASRTAQQARINPEIPDMTFTYFTVKVEQVLLSDGRIEEGGTFLLRESGSASQSAGTYENLSPFPNVGSRSLFVLGINPDFESYGTWGPWGRIQIDGPTVTYSDWDTTPVPFAEGNSPSEFINRLMTTIEDINRSR